MENGTVRFLNWLDDEIERRGISQNWVEDNARNPRGKSLSRGTISAIKKAQNPEAKKNRKLTAEHVIRISRALRVQFLQSLSLAGYIKSDEVGLSKTFVPDNPYLYNIWNGLKELDDERLKLVEEPILSIIKACKNFKGGDSQETAGDLETGYG